MSQHPIVSKEEWVVARKNLLVKEKQLTRLRDQVSQERQNLPWEKVDKRYSFDGPGGKESLSDLFEGKRQLIVYHFMFDPEWDAGCKACSYLADHYNGTIVHLNQRDVALVTVSEAPLDKLEAYKRRMGWTFKWVSSFGTDFNRDYHVAFAPDQKAKGEVYYNYRTTQYFSAQGPGISVFYTDDHRSVFHTYSSFARGLDTFIGTYHLLDIVPKGRDESRLPHSMAWVRRRDEYDDQPTSK